MGRLAVNPQTGEMYALTPGGWQKVDPAEVVQVGESGAGRAFAQNMAGASSPLQDALYPTATALGGLAGAGLGLLPGARFGQAGAAAYRGARAADRVAAGIQSAGRASEARGASTLGGDSVGAAAVGAPTGQMRTLGERFIDEITAGAEMTADQKGLLDVGKRLGFEELPGMRGRADSPGRLWMSSYMSNPAVRFAVQDSLDANLAIIEKLAMRALGAPDLPYGVQGFGEATRRLSGEFERIKALLPEQVTLPGGFQDKLKGIRGLSKELDDVVELDGTISRDDLFRLRSDLNLAAKDLAEGEGRRLAANRVGQVSKELDDFIRDQLGPEEARAWQVARERWLISELMQKPGVMQPDGSLSWRTIRGVMNRDLPDAWRKVLEGERRGLSKETSDFMDAVRYANAFGDLVPNSGTATRQAIGKMSTLDYLKGQALRYYLKRERDLMNVNPGDLP